MFEIESHNGHQIHGLPAIRMTNAHENVVYLWYDPVWRTESQNEDAKQITGIIRFSLQESIHTYYIHLYLIIYIYILIIYTTYNIFYFGLYFISIVMYYGIYFFVERCLIHLGLFCFRKSRVQPLYLAWSSQCCAGKSSKGSSSYGGYWWGQARII